MYQTLAATNMDDKELTESMQKLLIVMQRLDEKIAPMLEADGEHFNRRFNEPVSWNFYLYFVRTVHSSIHLLSAFKFNLLNIPVFYLCLVWKLLKAVLFISSVSL